MVHTGAVSWACALRSQSIFLWYQHFHYCTFVASWSERQTPHIEVGEASYKRDASEYPYHSLARRVLSGSISSGTKEILASNPALSDGSAARSVLS